MDDVWSLGTMGYGLPTAIGVQIANPKVSSRYCWWSFCLMTMQEMSTGTVQITIKIFILNNEYMGMVRQWQTFTWENYSESYTAALPDFVKLAGPMVNIGIRAKTEWTWRKNQRMLILINQ